MFGVYLPLAYLGSYLFGLIGVFSAIGIAYFVEAPLPTSLSKG